MHATLLSRIQVGFRGHFAKSVPFVSLHRTHQIRTMATKGNHVLLEIDESKYDAQLAEKKARIDELFAEFRPPQLEVFPSKPTHYRMRYVSVTAVDLITT